MEKGETKDVTTLTVMGSSTVGRPDGRAAIVLETKEGGAMAFEVNLKTISILRRELALAETFLRNAPTKKS